MEQRAFGRTGLAVSVVGFGSWPMSGGDRYGAIEDAEAIRAIHRALDGGVNCVDTAPAYGFGHAEEVVGQALRGRRGRAVLVTKCGLGWDPGNPVIRRDTRPASLKREVDLSLRRLQTDVIDVYLIHWPNTDTPFEDAFGALDDIVRAGKVRFVGRVQLHRAADGSVHAGPPRRRRSGRLSPLRPADGAGRVPVLRAPRHRRDGLRASGSRSPHRRVHPGHQLRRAGLARQGDRLRPADLHPREPSQERRRRRSAPPRGGRAPGRAGEPHRPRLGAAELRGQHGADRRAQSRRGRRQPAGRPARRCPAPTSRGSTRFLRTRRGRSARSRPFGPRWSGGSRP